jgi:uncharacterized protein
LSRFVLDANVLLAGLAGRPTSPPAMLLAAVHNGDLEAVACSLLIQEVRDGLQKPYFRAKLNALEAMEAVEAAKPTRTSPPTRPAAPEAENAARIRRQASALRKPGVCPVSGGRDGCA